MVLFTRVRGVFEEGKPGKILFFKADKCIALGPKPVLPLQLHPKTSS